MKDTLDPLVPYWHTLLYEEAATNAGRDALLLTQGELGLDPDRYRHCSFTLAEAEAAFAALRDHE